MAALGGGVVGDTAGFAASVYMRGVAFRTATDYSAGDGRFQHWGQGGCGSSTGKNLLGAFKQPALVVADLDVLASLPAEQVACGMAEVIKAGVIADPVLFELLEATDGGHATYDHDLRSRPVYSAGQSR